MINVRQSRETKTINTRHTRNRMKTNNAQNTTQKTEKTTIDEQHEPNQNLQWMSNTDPTKNYNG